ncbi:hypothetical protein BLA29_004911 [Euroglyphus maynei]|uniref:Uncharacterized protein n=1 Tax=Euroglyphus maynei TaxID=6958 RepID=A0A1Y3B4Q0_EURMA|nr:hypothetical protein BLA29_004911 [Euroglyphus maynei]
MCFFGKILPVVSAPNASLTSSNNSDNVSQPIKAKNNKEPEIIKTSPIVNKKNVSNKANKKVEPIIGNEQTTTNDTVVKSAKQTQPTSLTSSSASEDQQVGTGFQKTPSKETKERSINRSVEARRKSKGLNRSSTAEILKLIKTKSRAEFGKSFETVDEDVEIEYLLDQLEKDGLENIDWEDIGLDEKEVKDIVEKNKDENGSGDNKDDNVEVSSESESSSSEEDSDSDSDDDDDDMEHTVFKPIAPIKPDNNLSQPTKIISTATLTVKPVQKKLEVESEEETDDDDSSEEETETESD